MRVLIVEDEILIAMEVESILSNAGHICIGIAADSAAARAMARSADLVLVDLNLRDGATGQDLGISLADKHGLKVVFMTADPQELRDGIDGPIGVLPKPVSEPELLQLLDYVESRTATRGAVEPPMRMTLFHQAA
ncbi:MAG: response regulator [Pararhizobium sp.]